MIDQFHGVILYFINGERLTDIIQQKDQVTLIDLCLKVSVGGCVNQFGEYFLGIDAHLWGQDDFFHRFFNTIGNL